MTWSATDAGSGIKNYTVQVSANGGTYATIALVTPTRNFVDRSLSDGVSYRFRVRAVDREGNISAWRYSITFKPARFQESTSLATYVGTWGISKSVNALGGAARTAAAVGRTATFKASAYDIGLVWTQTTTSGSADIYVDGVFASRINLRATSTIVPPAHLRPPLADAREPHDRDPADRHRPGRHRRVRGPALTRQVATRVPVGGPGSQLLHYGRLDRSPMIRIRPRLGLRRPLLGDRHLPPGDDPDRCVRRPVGRRAARDQSRLHDDRVLPRRRRRDDLHHQTRQSVPEDPRIVPVPPTGQKDRARRMPRSCVWSSVSSEQVDPRDVAEAAAPAPKSGPWVVVALVPPHRRASSSSTSSRSSSCRRSPSTARSVRPAPSPSASSRARSSSRRRSSSGIPPNRTAPPANELIVF